MDPAVFLAALLIFVGIPAFTVIKVARLRATRPQSVPADVAERLDELERSVDASSGSWRIRRNGSISQSAYSASRGKSPALAAE
jgi:hypothetical protein